MTTCQHARLAAAVAFHAGQAVDPPEPCDEPATWYVRLVQADDDDFVTEHMTNLCDEHDRQAREFDGHESSSRRRDRPAA